jgi:hypothetical protein
MEGIQMTVWGRQPTAPLIDLNINFKRDPELSIIK